MAQRRGKLINSFFKLQKLLLKIKRLRAVIKKFGGPPVIKIKAGAHPLFVVSNP